MQTEQARVADCAGKEMESSVRRGSLFNRLQLAHCSRTRGLVVALPETVELYSVLLCASRPAVEVIIVADISAVSALDTGAGEARAPTLGAWAQQVTGSQVFVHSDTRMRIQKESDAVDKW